jgi:inositol-pentakisphosphate 2-kinase
MASDEIPVIPDSTGFSYFNEGAANIVYRILVRYPTPEPSLIEEYGEGTPPPSEVDTETGLYKDKVEKLQVFDSKHRLHTCSSQSCTPPPPFFFVSRVRGAVER